MIAGWIDAELRNWARWCWSVDDMGTVALALRQALLVVESAQRGAMN